jgi:molecular chaperone GrpE (heat shock protein)
VRLLGGEIDYSSEHFASMPVNWIDNLEDAIAQAVSLAKSTAKT